MPTHNLARQVDLFIRLSDVPFANAGQREPLLAKAFMLSTFTLAKCSLKSCVCLGSIFLLLLVVVVFV